MLTSKKTLVVAGVLIILATIAVTTTHVYAKQPLGCTGNPHDHDSGPTGNPHDASEPTGNPHDQPGGHHEGADC
jgi:hypothetical protein